MSTNSGASAYDAASDTTIAEQLAVLRADLAQLSATVAGDVSDGVESASRKLGETGREAKAAATSAVIGHPLTAVALAAGVGLILGILARKG